MAAAPSNPFPAEISSVRLTMRRLAPSDRDALVRVTNHAAITKRVSFLPTPFTARDAENLLSEAESEMQNLYAVMLEGREMIGFFGAHKRGEKEMEIGYWIEPARHGQGFASEALATMCTALKAYFADRRIYAECMPDNAASLRILAKNGFTPAGQPGQRTGRDKYLLTG